jgi:hypothetical protein
MAWPASDNFESYADGANLDGANGGSGWATAWAKGGSGVAWDVVSTPTLTGTRCGRLYTGSTSTCQVDRTIADTTTGAVSFQLQYSTSTLGYALCSINTTGGSAYVVLDADGTFGSIGAGKIIAVNGGSKVDLGSFSANTTYTFVIDFNTTSNQHRISIDGGAFSAYYAFSGVPSTGVTSITFQNNHGASNGTRYVYFDVIASSGGIAHTATLSETLTLLESAPRSVSRALTETVTLSDPTVTAGTVKTKTLAEVMALTDPPVAASRTGPTSWTEATLPTSIWTQQFPTP